MMHGQQNINIISIRRLDNPKPHASVYVYNKMSEEVRES
jgi:hypothetical protein